MSKDSGILMHRDARQWSNSLHFGCFHTQILAFVVIEFSYLLFHASFESAAIQKVAFSRLTEKGVANALV